MTTLELCDVGLTRDGQAILDGIDWAVEPGEQWIVIGPNGSGKTSLMRVASLYLHPTSGAVRVLGETLGRTDVRRLRERIGITSAGFADLLRPGVTVIDVVMTAKHAALEAWWHTYDASDRDRAVDRLTQVGVGHLRDRTFGTLSSGERQRVLLARTLMADPELLLLDEPNAGLDLAGREELVQSLTGLAAAEAAPPMVLVTHHLEEIPTSFTHVLMLRAGRALARGPLDQTLDDTTISDCFDLPLMVHRDGAGRWSARLRSDA